MVNNNHGRSISADRSFRGKEVTHDLGAQHLIRLPVRSEDWRASIRSNWVSAQKWSDHPRGVTVFSSTFADPGLGSIKLEWKMGRGENANKKVKQMAAIEIDRENCKESSRKALSTTFMDHVWCGMRPRIGQVAQPFSCAYQCKCLRGNCCIVFAAARQAG
ncbi:hypothetical protein CC1G_15037 [Coprinopsis cinerea okayama7|uniref:Uncharacterized protein n=1 Tax=Coprinopsis cinerea (strain Okayama-7 / 130 / ATCC MYA-4618 / FGSC 9003) TaxID=240176 RepID=D6RPE4_COPC7|nr:hypothetical protein CC1G_15037 [Coprinopsis cinerea okayama7\|eukprot:XP_002910706.1 hypothetical protein CC1G_15037 [Coprinopsis cinerea okayama7\